MLPEWLDNNFLFNNTHCSSFQAIEAIHFTSAVILLIVDYCLDVEGMSLL